MFLDRLKACFVDFRRRDAFCINDRKVSYVELGNLIREIVLTIQEHEILITNNRIAIFCRDDIETYASIMACWFTGNAFIPLYSDNPIERNLEILNDSKVDFILGSRSSLNEIYSSHDIVDNTAFKFDNEISTEFELTPTDRDSVAYILFTSGSTGKPKGVPLTFENLDSFLVAFDETPVKIRKEDRCLQMFELTFDVSISSFVPALLAGACVYTIPRGPVKYVKVLQAINKFELSVIQIVPSVIRLGKPLLSRVNFYSVRICVCTGEATEVDLLGFLKDNLKQAMIYNFYGPTESAIYCSFYDCNKELVESYNGLLAIGIPFNRSDLKIIADNLEEADDMEKGELHIKSPQLTPGYIDATLDFDRFTMIQGSRYYKTGDICFKDERGVIYFCGRLDNQVQIQGFRVELNEIEFKIKAALGIDCIVLQVQNKFGLKELALFTNQVQLREETIRSSLKDSLPTYMMPTKFHFVEKFPLTSSGKADRFALKSLLL